MSRRSVLHDPFDVYNFDKQMRHYMSTKSPDVSVPDELVEPEYEKPNQIQINVVDASKLVGNELEYLDAQESSNETMWLKEKKTKGLLPDAPKDARTKKFEADWYPNDLDNLPNMPNLAETFVSSNGYVDRNDRYGYRFLESDKDMQDYVDLKANETSRVLDHTYRHIN